MHYVGISTYQFILYYATAIHKHKHKRILKPFEGSEPTGQNVDTADRYPRSSHLVFTPSQPVRLYHGDISGVGEEVDYT